MAQSELTTISLFSGIGGLDFGFEAAGFHSRVAVDMDPVACQTLRANRPNWTVLERDIHKLSSKEILKAADLKVGDADVLIGGPPCQPFSKSSYCVNGSATRLNDQRSRTLTAYLRVLRDTKPKSFLLENVCGLAYRRRDEGLNYLLQGIANVNEQIGTNYSVAWKVLNAAQYGVPQIRERIFLIGSRDGTKFEFPPPTHNSPKKLDLLTSEDVYRTTWDAIGDLVESQDDEILSVGGKWGPLLPSIPEGKNYLWHTSRGGGIDLFDWRSRYWTFLLKLSKHLPSWTIQAQPGSANGPFHWHNRKLTTQEICRLQTFPQGLLLDCGRTHSQRLLGNAAPSLLVEILAREIQQQFLSSPIISSAPLLTIPVRTPVPKAEPVSKVPNMYFAMVGESPSYSSNKTNPPQ